MSSSFDKDRSSSSSYSTKSALSTSNKSHPKPMDVVNQHSSGHMGHHHHQQDHQQHQEHLTKAARKEDIKDTGKRLEEALESLKDSTKKLLGEVGHLLDAQDTAELAYSRVLESEIEESTMLREAEPEHMSVCNQMLQNSGLMAMMGANDDKKHH